MSAAAVLKQTIESHRTKSVREKTLLLATAIISVIIIFFVWSGAHGVGQYLLKAQANEASVYWLGAIRKHFLDFDCVLSGECATEDFFDTANLINDAGPVFDYGFFALDGSEQVVSWSRDVEVEALSPYVKNRLDNGEHIIEVRQEHLFGDDRQTVLQVILPLMKGDRFDGSVILFLDLTVEAKRLRGVGAQLFVASVLVLGAFWSMTVYVVWRNHRDRSRTAAWFEGDEGMTLQAEFAESQNPLDDDDPSDFGMFGKYD